MNDVVMASVDASDTDAAHCARHVLDHAVGTCGTCGTAYCRTCLVEIPAHGTTCTGCALEHAGVRTPRRTGRRGRRR